MVNIQAVSKLACNNFTVDSAAQNKNILLYICEIQGVKGLHDRQLSFNC